MGSKVPLRLRGLRAPFDIEFHDDKKHGFSQAEEDDKWLSEVAKKKWIVISHDRRFHKNSLAMEAVKQHGGRVFYLDGGSSVSWDKLRRFAFAYKRIVAIASQQKAPFIYRVTYADRVIPVRRY